MRNFLCAKGRQVLALYALAKKRYPFEKEGATYAHG